MRNQTILNTQIMKLRPMSFNYPMVQSLKSRTKTVTRRLQKEDEQPFNSGDIIWVREPFTSEYSEVLGKWVPIYQADCSKWEMEQLNFKESYMMPKKYARFFLKVTNVTSENLLDITNSDALKEGISADLTQSHSQTKVPWCFNYVIKRFLWSTPRESFLSFFEWIYGMEIINKNPKVWRYEFEYLEISEILGEFSTETNSNN